MAYNRNSGTFLAVGSDGGSLEVAAAEMKINGEPNTVAQIITDGAKKGSNYPMVSARTNTSQWNVAYERDFGAAVSQFIATSTTGGGSPGAPAPPPPAPAPTPGPTLGCTTPDPFASIGGGTCVNGGWVPGGGAEAGGTAPGGCTSAAPAPGWTCVNGGWLPPRDRRHGRDRRLHDRPIHSRRLVAEPASAAAGCLAGRAEARPVAAQRSRQQPGGHASTAAGCPPRAVEPARPAAARPLRQLRDGHA